MKTKPLVIEHLEDISAATLDKYQDIIRDYIRGKHGICALYKRNQLYYVGLASSLGGRLRQHLRDRHGGSWDRFSVYLTRRADYMKELESLLLRIVQPTGNRQSGKFPRSADLKKELSTDLRQRHRDELAELVGSKKKRRRAKANASKAKADKRGEPQPPMKALIGRNRALRGTVRGEWVRAKVMSSGWIRYDGYDYFSPSEAAKEAAGARRNGWAFWEYQKARGDWVPIGELR